MRQFRHQGEISAPVENVILAQICDYQPAVELMKNNYLV